jgi:glycosyltransferase involved in cell wall biosynthesis
MTQTGFSNIDKNPRPLVSLIVRTFNRPRFLREALQSICAQIYPNIEIVVINDGGTDVGPAVNGCTEQVSTLQLVQLPMNIGRSGAANRGLSVAKGEFIGFLDDDDTLDPDHIDGLVQALQQYPEASVVYAGVRVENDKGQVESYFNFPFDRQKLLASNFIPIHAVLFSRRLIEEKGIRFDEGVDFYEDWDFWLQLSRHASFLHVDKISATYRAQGQSGVGLKANINTQKQGRERLFDKWRMLLTGKDLNHLAEYAHDLEQKLTEHKNLIAGLNQAISERDDHIAGLNQAISERDDHIAGLNRVIISRNNQIADLNLALAKRNEQINDLNRCIADRDYQIQQIFRSTSWRLTYPLRAIKALLAINSTTK